MNTMIKEEKEVIEEVKKPSSSCNAVNTIIDNLGHIVFWGLVALYVGKRILS